jgi:hypothetical protein
MEWSASLLTLGKKTNWDKKQIKNLREEFSVVVPNRDARKKYIGGDKTDLNESGVENMRWKVLTVPNGGFL